MTDGAGPGEPVMAFDRHRHLLFTVAYQMLGSVADAEDAVQDAWLRWSTTDRADVLDPRSYLVQIVTRLALARLRSAQRRRETYPGPWLPEPLRTDESTSTDPAGAAELGEQVSLAVLVVLETLTPLERAVFVLREVFGLPWNEVAGALDRSPAAVRQLGHRAREHVQGRRPRFDADREVQREVTERFLAACAGGDLEALVAVLAPGAVLVSDGGGQAKAALRPIVGSGKTARFLIAVAAAAVERPGTGVGIVEMNGSPGILLWDDGGPTAVVSLVVADARVHQVLVVLNPDKLAGTGSPRS